MRARRGLWCASVVLLSSGCGLFSAQADPPAPSSTPSSSTAAPTPSATPATAPAGAVAALVDSMGRPARLSVTAGPVVPGVPPLLGPDGTDGACGLTGDTAEYAEVTVVFTVPGESTKADPVTANLHLDLSVPDGAGVFLETDDPSAECAGGTGLPAHATWQTLYLAAAHQSIRVYVVGRVGAVQGGSLRLDKPHYDPASTDRPRTWTVSQVTGGTTCDGDPSSLCVPLG